MSQQQQHHLQQAPPQQQQLLQQQEYVFEQPQAEYQASSYDQYNQYNDPQSYSQQNQNHASQNPIQGNLTRQQHQQHEQHIIRHEPTELITQRLKDIDQQINLMMTQLNECRHKGEEFNIALQKRHYYSTKIVQVQNDAQADHNHLMTIKKDKENIESMLQVLANELNGMRITLSGMQRDIFDSISNVQNNILFDRLPIWHQQQQMYGNTSNASEIITLEIAQLWVELLISVTWKLRNQVKCLLQLMVSFFSSQKVRLFKFDEELNTLGICIDKSLETLVSKSLIVEKQPPQVMKTNTRFASTVRFLGGQKLNLHLLNPIVRVTILSEGTARAVIKRHQDLIRSSWDYIEYKLHEKQQQEQETMSSPSGTYPNETAAQIPVSPVSQVSQSPVPRSVIQSTPQQFSNQTGQQYYSSSSHQQYQQPIQQETQVSSPAQSTQQEDILFNSNCVKIVNLADFESSGEILNAANNLECQDSGQLVWHFRNMQLKKIKRTEKKGTESVMDEKFVLLFHAEFRIADTEGDSWNIAGNLSFHIMAFSLPVVVIVHGNQEPHAVATVTWHNAFAKPDYLLYKVPERVYWHELGHVLSEKFRMNAGKGLNSQNLDYLAKKVCRGNVCSGDAVVTWTQFAKELLPDKNFTFWEWLYSILKLTREHLAKLWEGDKIYGFVGKMGCVELLLNRSHNNYESKGAPVGTFLLRYSETELGGITIAWVAPGSSFIQNGYIENVAQEDASPSSTTNNIVLHIQPYLSKDLHTRSLADRVRDLNNLLYLYPDVPKDQAFGQYYTPLTDSTSYKAGSYVKPMLIQLLVENYPGKASSSSSPMMENSLAPTTPNSLSQQTPPSGTSFQPHNYMDYSYD